MRSLEKEDSLCAITMKITTAELSTAKSQKHMIQLRCGLSLAL